jgi:hypothetical protein
VRGFLRPLSTPALAQKPAELPNDGAGILPWAIGGGIAVLMLIPPFLNPKRSHHKK